MMSFRAWFLPPGFSLQDSEIAEGGGSDGAPFRYPALSAERLRDLMDLLRREREKTLLSRELGGVVESVDRVARRFLDAEDPLREEAAEGLALFAGYSGAMAREVLDGMAGGWRSRSLWSLLRSEFRDPGVLDGFRPGPGGGRIRAMGFPLTCHLGAGSVPGVATTSMARALLVKSSVLLKPGMGDLVLPVAFARGLEEEDPELARSVAVLYWPAGEGERTEAILRGADLVVAYGSDETIRWVRERLPPWIPLRAYRHRMGFGVVGREALREREAEDVPDRPGRVAREAARAVALFDQKGCVSPHVLFVEEGGRVTPEEWSEELAGALEELEETLPSGRLSSGEGAALQQLRGAAEMEEGAGRGRVLHGGTGAPWTVRFRPDGPVEPSCLNRTVAVIPVGSVGEALAALSVWTPYLQTVGVAGLGKEERGVLEALARLGVSRVARMGDVPWPAPWWHHDGSGPLQDLVRWTDVEGPVPFSSDSDEG